MLKNCCCMRLQTGGLIIGWLGVVFSILSVALVIVAFSNINDRTVESSFNEFENYRTHSNERLSDLNVCRMFLAVAVINLISSIMLLTGLLKRRHLMLLPWLVNMIINIAILCIYLLIGVFLMTLYPISSGIFAPILAISIALAFTIYLYCVIYSLYKELQSENDLKELPMTQTQFLGVPHNTTTYPIYAKV